MLRVGIDTGGTFTDCIVVDESSGRLALSKIPSTPSDLSTGILAALSQASAEMYGYDGDALERDADEFNRREVHQA